MAWMFAAIEAGGTTFVVAAGARRAHLVPVVLPTSDPTTTLDAVVAWLRERGPFDGLGIAAFGPVEVDPSSDRYGVIGATPKLGWRGVPIGPQLGEALDCPWALDTDVNAAALAEGRWGACRGLDDFVYVTIGTGIGGGAVSSGRLVQGLLHPEMGHVPMQRADDDTFEGSCPFHGDCFEGLASGRALEARWGRAAEDLPPDHPAWDLEARYLASGLHTITCVLAPQRIALGGGVMAAAGLLDRTRHHLRERLAGYLRLPESFLVAPALGAVSGLHGAFALAERAQSSRG